MNKIHQLPEDLVSRIAAGEVVERPASVLKELVENSLDAGATDISIIIEGAGRTRLHVSDNGCGMNKADALLCLSRHATSKITKLEDLEGIHSFGFRGEAIPSIAAVSRFHLTTRAADEENGWSLEIEGGRLVDCQPVARECGTTIDVRDLFFNTPARFKFLKADFTERAQCMRVIEELVFASPTVTFRVQVEQGKPLIFQSHADESDRFTFLKRRVADAWGTKWQAGLYPVEASQPHFSVFGVISNQDSHTSSAKNQFLYVNRRPVQNRRLTRAVYDAYVGQLPTQRHPSWILFLDVNPQAVDVNVHPSKREVKLAFEGEIYGFLLSAARRALQPAVAVASAASQVDTAPFGERRAAPSGALFSMLHNLYKPVDEAPRSEAKVSEPAAPDWFQSQSAVGSFLGQQFRARTQIRNTFIVADYNEGFVIVDQHAAAEKVLYEKLMANMSAQKPKIQMMLVPFSWEVSLSLSAVVQAKIDDLQKMGFVIEPFGGNMFLVQGVPAALGDKYDLHSLLDGVSDVLVEGSDKRSQANTFHHKLAAMTACKASVRAGDPLDLKSCQALLDELVQCEAPQTCPHGRPTVIDTRFTDLERRFRRT